MSEILGVLFAIIVATMTIPKFAEFQRISNENQRISATAQQHKKLIGAGTQYIQQNATAIQAAATPTTSAIITVAMLQAPGVNLLDSGFSATNPFGQTWQIEVLEPSAGNLQAFALSTGGTAMRDAQVIKVASLVGAAGGFIPQNDTGIYAGGAANAYGAFAGWTVPTANYTSAAGGHPAALISFNNGQLVSNYLYRNAVPGQPQLNVMNTPLNMQAKATENSSDSLCVVGDTSTYGRIAADANGRTMNCVNGVWKRAGDSTWKEPVVTFAALPMTGNTVGDVRMATDISRGFTWDGLSWKALAVDQNGVLSTGKALLNDVVSEGTACSQNGMVARDLTGLILSCQSGVWKKIGSSFGTGTWRNVTGSRGNWGTYVNNHGKPIFIAVSDYPNGYYYSSVWVYVDGNLISTNIGIGDMKNTTNQSSAMMLVPEGSTYTVGFQNGVYSFWEFW